MITVYEKGTNAVRAVIDPDDQSAQQCGIMREDNVTLTFKRPDWIAFQIGDYADFFTFRYQINKQVEYNKIGTRDYEYTVTMESYMYDLGKTGLLFLNASNQFTEGRFSLRCKPIDLINLIIANLKRRDPSSNWIAGTVIDADYQTIDFDSQNCLEALSTAAQTFNTEYLVQGQTISLFKKQLVSGVTLERGQGKALVSIQLQNQGSTSGASNGNLITRLYAYGNNTNIGSNYRGGAQYLRMAVGLYIDKNTVQLGVFEDTVFFDGTNGLPDIYPHRVGVVSAVTSPFIFTDADIDFDVNVYDIIPGATAQITFNTGQLAGYTFDIDTFDYATKTFTINANTQEQTVVVPSDTLQAAPGDEYVITNIEMPLAYFNDAEAQLLAAAKDYLNTYGPALINYPVGCNNLYFESEGLELQLGYVYTLKDNDTGLNRQIRLVEFTRNIRQPYKYTALTLADIVPVQPLIVKLINTL